MSSNLSPVNRTELHRGSAASAGLAAAICMAITQVLGLIIAPGNLASTLLVGLSFSSIAFGGTYAGAFFVSLFLQSRASNVGDGRSAA